MKIKVDVKHLKLGMRICELDRPWEETPFLLPGFAVQTLGDLEELARYCDYVFVDLDDEEDKAAAAEFALLKTAACPRATARPPSVALGDELAQARTVYSHAALAIEQAAYAVRAGRRVAASSFHDLVRGLSESVGRHPDALLLVTRLSEPVNGAVYRAVLALLAAWALGATREEREAIGLGALFADLGLHALPDALLNRTGPLSADEHTLVRRHVADSLALLEHERLPAITREFIARHHERMDGSGYPAGLRDAEIGRYGLLGGLADHFAAVTRDRPYRAAASPFEALQGMYLQRGKSFCPTLLEEFIHAHGIYPAGTGVELSNGRIGMIVERNPGRPLKPRIVLIERDSGCASNEIDLSLHPRDEHGQPWEIVRLLPPHRQVIDGADLLDYLTRDKRAIPNAAVRAATG